MKTYLIFFYDGEHEIYLREHLNHKYNQGHFCIPNYFRLLYPGNKCGWYETNFLERGKE